MIKSIPPVWDETIVLSQSEIGESAIFAQRKGADWFLSVMNGVKPKSFTIPLTFLGGYSYSTYILEDDPENPASVIISEKQSTRDEVITLSLGEGGGYMVRFIPK
jgi:alpha-glucosidase